MAAKVISSKPIVSKVFCSSSQVVLAVRKRPHVVYGGGFVVSDCGQKIVFRVDGCGMLGKQEELIVRDGDGDALLLIRRKRGIVEALNINKQWKGHAVDFEGPQRLVFSLKEPKSSCLVKNNPIRISTEPKGYGTKWDFEIKGYFKDKACCIIDSHGNIIAQVGVEEEAEELIPASKDLYHVVVKPGIDQAFIIGLIAVLDYIYDGSTRC
ncbi:protein LURP-one-related 6 [Diospyros lotus]|uniref:protein LURP-one-related 6 n=1 Tax=Diospyros lotus TaxID=55363 RepID=UPI002251A3FA|nr:protein LURP-one-related 6 [Diospyros lotus]